MYAAVIVPPSQRVNYSNHEVSPVFFRDYIQTDRCSEEAILERLSKKLVGMDYSHFSSEKKRKHAQERP